MKDINTIAVMAGTKIDTQMGVDFVSERVKANIIPLPISANPQEQTLFQVSPNKDAVVEEILRDAMSKGADALFVYCNSLSGSVDFRKLSAKLGLKTITPLDIYRTAAKNCSRIGVIAANNQALSGIEAAMLEGNPEVEVLGVAMLPLVKGIEKGIAPEELVEQMGLRGIMSYFKTIGCDTVVLGCTHFPYVKNELLKVLELPLIDPAEDMLNALFA